MGNSKKKHIELLLDEKRKKDVNKIYKTYLEIQSKEIKHFCELTQDTKKAFDLLKYRGIKVGITTGYD